MKYSYLPLAFLVLTSCGKTDDKNASFDSILSSENIDLLKTERTKLDSKLAEISKNIDLIDDALRRLDTTSSGVLVEGIVAEKSVFKHYVELQGSVKTQQNVMLSSEYSGIIRSITHREGDSVEKGTLLAIIGDGGLKDQIEQVKINLNLSKTSYERQKRLWDEKIGSEMQYLQAEANYMAEKNKLKQLNSQLEKTLIRAPFSGVIDGIVSEEGHTVSPGTPILRIVNLHKMEVEAEIPEAYLKNVKPGSEISLYFKALNETYQTKVRQVSNYINPNNRSFKIVVDLDNKSMLLKPNLTCALKVTDYVNPNAILIPESAILENGQHENYVFVTTNIKNGFGLAKRVFVRIGKRQNNMAEVLEGLDESTFIITEGWKNLKDNQKVKVVYGE